MILVLVFCLTKADIAPRTAFLTSYVYEDERTQVMGLVNVVKMLAQSLGPTITGWLASRDLMWVSFVAAGVLQAGYDLAMLYFFTTVKLVS